jgi:hypothetical protein
MFPDVPDGRSDYVNLASQLHTSSDSRNLPASPRPPSPSSIQTEIFLSIPLASDNTKVQYQGQDTSSTASNEELSDLHHHISSCPSVQQTANTTLDVHLKGSQNPPGKRHGHLFRSGTISVSPVPTPASQGFPDREHMADRLDVVPDVIRTDKMLIQTTLRQHSFRDTLSPSGLPHQLDQSSHKSKTHSSSSSSQIPSAEANSFHTRNQDIESQIPVSASPAVCTEGRVIRTPSLSRDKPRRLLALLSSMVSISAYGSIDRFDMEPWR